MATARDPVSVMFDAGARRMLARAYATPGSWQGTRLRDPSPADRRYLATLGINPDGPDAKSGRGGLNARTRWARGFVRALYHRHTETGKRGGIQVEVGRALRGGAQEGSALVPGRAVRVRYWPTGTRAAVRASSAPSYTLDDDARSVPGRRDWQTQE